LTKCQEALYFYIHPYFGPKKTFQSYSYTFSSKFGDFMHIFNTNEKKLAEKDYFHLTKRRHRGAGKERAAGKWR